MAAHTTENHGQGSGDAGTIKPARSAWEKLQRLHSAIEDRANIYVEQLSQRTDYLEQHAGVLTAMLQSVGDGLVIADREGRIVLSNGAAEQILGVTVADSLAVRWPAEHFGFFWPDTVTRIPPEEQPLERAIKGLETESIVFIRNQAHPTGRWVRVHATPVRDRSGAVHGGVAVFHDITDSKLKTERIHDLYNNAPCGYHSVGPDGLFLEMNDTELAWLGYAREEVIGKLHCSSIVSSASKEVLAQHFTELIDKGSVREVSLQLLRKDGSTMSALWSASTVRDSAGNFVMSRSVIFDITDRAKLTHQRDALAAIITNELKNHFVGGGRLLGLALQGEFGPLTVSQEETLLTLQAENSHQLQMTNNLVEAFRYDMGMEMLHFESTDVRPLILGCIDEVLPSLSAAGLQLEPNLLESLHPVSADPGALRHLFSNLFSSCMKFTPAGGSIRVQAYNQNGQVVVDVANTGDGIPEEEQEALFSEVWHGDVSEKPVGSVGLGLYLCRKIVEAHGGGINCSATKGIGTTLTVSLPAIKTSSQHGRSTGSSSRSARR